MKSSVVRMARTFKNWPIHYWAKLAKPEYVTYRLRNGIEVRLRANTNDKTVLKDIWVDDMYSPPGFEIGATDTVIDIGGHIGVFTLFAAFHASRGRVYAFEPMPVNFGMLAENVRLNGLGNVVARQMGVAAETTRRPIHIARRNTGGHSLYFDEGGAEQLQVEVISLPDILREHSLDRVDYLKLDCEGAEHEILRTLPDEIFATIGKIGMECHDVNDENTCERMRGYLETKGYQVAVRPEDHDRWMIYARRG